MTPLDEIGAVVAQHRAALGLTWPAAAERCGVCRRTLYTVERGTRPVRTEVLQRVIDGLQIEGVTWRGLDLCWAIGVDLQRQIGAVA